MTDTPTTARARPAQTEIPIHDRIPPHDIGAEQALLGSMMIDPTCIDGILEFVTGPGQFWKEENGKLFSVLLDMHRKGAAMDGVTIIGTLTRVGKLEAVGGHDYINATISSVPSAAHAEHYAAAVRDHALLRRLISAGGRITRSGHEGGDVREIVDQAEKIIFEIGNATGSRAVTVSITDALAEALARADGQNAGLPTGLARLDELTNGMHPGEMIVIAARPSMGKTSLALNIADHIACKLGQGVLFFSKEMSRIELAQRMICSRAHVDSQRVKRNQIIADERAALKLSLQEMEGAPMWIDDSPGGTIGDFRAAARRQCAAQDVKIIILDYLQLLEGSGGRGINRQESVSEISRGIKAAAKELNTPIIALSQLNRSSDTDGRRPRLSELRESGAIEQDADVVMLLHNEAIQRRGDQEWADANPDKLHLAEIIVAKQRNGPCDTIKTTFIESETRFCNYNPGI